ncbi:MAG: DJ-1/PfpI family protein [Lachnospiraceae bacterium]|nr:DJ-1/PfpI family protein [Lachnospiraceae bacterium]
MEKVYVFLADGFEEIEGLTVVDILRRVQVETVTVSIMGKHTVTGSHGIQVEADAVFEDVDFEDGTLYVLPGGMPGTKHLGAHEGLRKLLLDSFTAGKRIAAICAAPSVLGDLGILRGKKAACYPGFEARLTGAEVTSDQVAVDGTVTTSRGMGTAIPFALALVAQLKDQETSDELGRAIIWS